MTPNNFNTLIISLQLTTILLQLNSSEILRKINIYQLKEKEFSFNTEHNDNNDNNDKKN
jgi:hypothetical protein